MPISPLSGGGGIDEVWGDFSGGIIIFQFIHPSYTGTHGFRVIPFDTAGTGLFTSPPTGTTNGLQQEADNLCTLIAALYNPDTTISALAATQTLADHSGQAPYPFSFAGSSTSVGTAGGVSLPVPDVLELVSRGADGSRWRVQLPGYSTAITDAAAHKETAASSAGAVRTLVDYLGGQSNGPTHAVKTNVVTHNGVPVLFSPMTIIQNMNKRLRRHFKVV